MLASVSASLSTLFSTSCQDMVEFGKQSPTLPMTKGGGSARQAKSSTASRETPNSALHRRPRRRHPRPRRSPRRARPPTAPASMDTCTHSASPRPDDHLPREPSPPPQDKISAYYSLVFPGWTFYIQMLSITIGRRCAPNANAPTSSTAEQAAVDVDLGNLRSVSRLHAKIEYDQEEDRFVLVVIGRNGAWVDGVWCGAGSRATLGERYVRFSVNIRKILQLKLFRPPRSHIQIASRTFTFVLPPPSPPEDTPSPSSQSSANRARSPSVDITSISPPSSQPSNSPPPRKVKLPPPSPEPQIDILQDHDVPERPELPNSNSIGKGKGAISKKRKKGDVDPLPLKRPDVMPPKPPFTYAQLIHRAIKDIDGKATLQEICNWIITNHDYYKYADSAWMVSILIE